MAHGSIKNLNIDGNVIISGSTTSIDVTQLTTTDPNITLNDVPIIITSGTLESGPLDTNANGGGLTLLGGTFSGGVHTPLNKTFNWMDATDSWTSSEHIAIATSKEYKIDTTSVLSATTLGAGVVSSSLTSVGTLTSLQVNTVLISGVAIGLTSDTNLITLTNDNVGVSGTVTATQLAGGGTGITGINTANIDSPGVAGDFIVSSGATGWAGLTPPISIALGGTGAITAAAARTALGVTATGVDPAYTLVANNLSDLASASTARTNLGLGTMAVETATDYLTVANDLSDVSSPVARTNLGLGSTDSPTFGGVGTGTVSVEATPSSGGTVAPTFAGVSFKSIPVASGSGHKWVVGNEQDGDLTFSYFAINDAGANTSSALGYITLDRANTRVIVGQAGGTPVNVVMSGLGYPTTDGTANQVLTTDGSAGLTFATPATTNITEGTNLYYTAARDTAQFNTDLATKTTANLAEGANLYYTTARWDTKMTAADTADLSEGTNLYYTNARADARIGAASINALTDVTITTPATNALLQYNGSAWIDAIPTTAHITEGANLYYTNARADARIVNAGSANWNTAYTDTNAATDAATNSTIVKRGATGNIAVSKVTADNGIVLGSMPGTATGGIQWTGTDFHGYNGSAWVSLTSAATAQLSGQIATFATTQTITSKTYVDIPGYTTAITVTNSNIINVQVTVAVGLASATIPVEYDLKLVRVIGGTSTDLYEDEFALVEPSVDNLGWNVTFADAHGQANGTVITYKLMAKVGTWTADVIINPNATNAQIFVYEITTTPTTVTSVNGASGTVVLDTDDITEGSSNLYYTDARADARVTIGVNAVIDSAPGTLDTLNELAAAMGDDANYAATITTALTGKLSVANDLSDVASASLSRTNLGLGTTDSPNFGGEGVGTTTITATPSSGGTVAPTFAGTSFKSVPVASGSGHKWVVGNEQAGNLTFSYFTIDDAGANTSSALGYITLDPANTWVALGQAGSTPVNVIIQGLHYPSADGTANQVLTTDGSNQLAFATPSTSNITEGTNLYYTDARADTRIALQVGANLDLTAVSTSTLPEGTNLYYTDTRADARADVRITVATITSLSDVDAVTSVDNEKVLYYNHATTSFKWKEDTSGLTNTDALSEGTTNLYYTDPRARAAVSVIPSYQLESVNLITPGFAGSGYQNIPSVYIDPPGFTGPTWTVIHKLDQKYVNFELIDTNHNVINTTYNAPTITYVDTNTLTVNWNGVSTDGFINVIKSRIGHNISADLQAAGNIWTINHTLTGTEGIVNLDVVQNNISYYGKSGFPLIEYTSTTQSRVIFPTGVTPAGYAVVHNSYLNAGAVGNAYLFTQASAATTWTITHNLGQKHLNVDVAVLGSEIDGTDFSITPDTSKYYNIKGLYDYPTINFVDENSLTITFLTTTAGKAIITGDDMTEMTSHVQAIGVPHMELGDSTPATCPPVAINNGGTGFVAGDVGKVYTVTGGTGTSATVTIATVSAGACTVVTLTTGGDYTALPSVTGCATTGASGSVGIGLTLDLNFRVKNVTLTALGAGYQTTPTITIGASTGTCGTKTTATGQVVTGGLNPLAYNLSTGVFSFQGDIVVTPEAVSDKDNTSTGSFILPTGTTAERPSTPVIGMMRFNTTTVRFEGYNGTNWVPIDTLYS
jgi:hypothetical protein